MHNKSRLTKSTHGSTENTTHAINFTVTINDLGILKYQKLQLQRPITYQIIYCLLYFALGTMFSVTVLILPFLSESLNISTSDTSALYSICYFTVFLGSLVSGKILSQSRWSNTHLVLVFLTIISCRGLFLIPLIKLYSIMMIIWGILGIWLGGLFVMPCVYVCRVYDGPDGAKMYTRMLLCMTLGSAAFSSIFDAKYIEILLYTLVALLLICCLFLTFILPTPKDIHTIKNNNNDKNDKNDKKNKNQTTSNSKNTKDQVNTDACTTVDTNDINVQVGDDDNCNTEINLNETKEAGIEVTTSMHDAIKDWWRKFYVWVIIFFFSSIYFCEGYLLPFASIYVENGLRSLNHLSFAKIW